MTSSGNLPQRLPIDQMQLRWASLLQPLLDSPTAAPVLLQLTLASGDNTVNHLLGRKLVGWMSVGFHGAYADLFDKQASNPIPDKTLILNSSAATAVTLMVF